MGQWFLAATVDNVQRDIYGIWRTLFVHPRSFQREAAQAAFTFLCCVQRMCAMQGVSGLLDVARHLIARPVYESASDSVWIGAYTARVDKRVKVSK